MTVCVLIKFKKKYIYTNIHILHVPTENVFLSNSVQSRLNFTYSKNLPLQVCAALCHAKGWQRAVVLYSGSGGGPAAALLARLGAPLALLARRLPPPEDTAALRDLLLVLKKSDKTNFVVWCDAECAHRVLEAAQRVGLLDQRHEYILPAALDLHTRDLDRFSHGGANITGG